MLLVNGEAEAARLRGECAQLRLEMRGELARTLAALAARARVMHTRAARALVARVACARGGGRRLVELTAQLLLPLWRGRRWGW